MFTFKKGLDIESHLRSFTHCWLFFHSTGDVYVAEIENFVFGSTRFTMCAKRLTKCVNYVTDLRYGIKRDWFPVKHYGRYTLPEFNLAMMRHHLNSRKESGPEHTSRFMMEKGDELIFTRDTIRVEEIERILSKAL